MLSNRELLQKADLALSELTSGGGLLQEAQAAEFMRLAVADAKVVKLAQVIPMKSSTQIVDKIRFGSRILVPSASNETLALADRKSPTLTKTTLTAVQFRAQVNIGEDTLQDNIEGGRFKDTVMEEMAKEIAADMDEIVIKGDTGSADAFLAMFNGIIAGATSNVVSAGSVNLSRSICKQTQKAMPNAFNRKVSTLKFLTSRDARTDIQESMADRQTPLGDVAAREETPVYVYGSEVVGCDQFPENPTSMIYTDPKNILVGIWRNISFKIDEDVDRDVIKIVAKLRFIMKFAEETAAVKTTNITTTG